MNLLLSLSLLLTPPGAADGVILIDAAAALAKPALRFELPATASCAGDRIRFGDLVEAPPEPLAEVDLAPAPLPGRSRELTRGQIELRLLRAGFDEAAVSLTGADTVIVQRVEQTISPAVLGDWLRDTLGDVRIDRLPPLRRVPPGEISFRLRQAPPEPLPERCTVAVDVLVNGSVRDELVVSLVGPSAPAVTAPTVAGPTPGAAPAPEPEPVPEPAFRVKRGDVLTLLAVAGSIEVSLEGTVRRDGVAGEVLPFEVIVSGRRRTLSARVIAPDRALVEL